MATSSPAIHTYHCLCNSLLLASTHTLSSLPRRREPSLDGAIILPLPSSPPTIADGESQSLPPEGYTMTLGMSKDSKSAIIRREDGFEKRLLWRCSRCRVVVGYELQGQGEKMDVDDAGNTEHYRGRVMYVLPGGVMSTNVMIGEKKIGDGDVDIRNGAVAAFE